MMVGVIYIKSCKNNPEIENNIETINIGLILPITPYPNFSQEMIDASNLAIQEINNAGGVLGKEIKLLIGDDNRDVITSVSEAKKLIEHDNVISLSLTGSSSSLAVFYEVMNTNDVLMISPASSSPEISSLADKNLVWRTMPSDVFQGKIAAEYIINNSGTSEVAVLYVNNTYGSGLVTEFINHFTGLGGTIVAQQSYEEQNSYDNFDFKPMLDLLFLNEPSFIYIINEGLELSKILTQIYTENYFTDTYRPVIMSGDAARIETIITNSPALIIEGMIGTSSFGIANEEFDANFMNFTGADITVHYARNMYDAIYLIAYAVLASKSSVPIEFAVKLGEVSKDGEVIGVNQFVHAKFLIERGLDIDYNGASGKIDFDENGDVTSGTYEIWKVENGEFVTVTTIEFP